MIPPDWMLKSDTITTQDERVRQAQKAYQQALARIKEDPENQSRRDDLEKAAKFLHDEVKQSWWDKRGRLLQREEFEGEMIQFIDPSAPSLEECEAIWQKSLTQDLTEEEWGRLVTFRGPEEVLANEMSQNFLNIGSEVTIEEAKPKKIQKKPNNESYFLLQRLIKEDNRKFGSVGRYGRSKRIWKCLESLIHDEKIIEAIDCDTVIFADREVAISFTSFSTILGRIDKDLNNTSTVEVSFKTSDIS